MATTDNTNAVERVSLRRRSDELLTIGVDTKGRQHYFDGARSRVLVLTDVYRAETVEGRRTYHHVEGRRLHVEACGLADLEDWIAHVAEATGWEEVAEIDG